MAGTEQPRFPVMAFRVSMIALAGPGKDVGGIDGVRGILLTPVRGPCHRGCAANHGIKNVVLV